MSLPACIMVCGVAGCGKSSVGRGLADTLGWTFLEGDQFHPIENKQKMARGEPLTDGDRVDWLALISDGIANSNGPVVVACSALRAAHRKLIMDGLPAAYRIEFVLLRVDKPTARRRIEQRIEHFFPSSLVDSQFDALEIADDVKVVEVGEDSVEDVVRRVLHRLK